MQNLREKWRHIIFGVDSPKGRLFDQILIVCILVSVGSVMLDSVASIHERYGDYLYMLEWFFTLLFTVEYLVRLYISEKPARYARSFFGIVDIISILPTYLSLIVPGANYLLGIRLLRALRIFRVFKLMAYMGEVRLLTSALYNARRKIMIFLYSVGVLMVVYGTFMYLIEGPANGFTSIPQSIYWAIVTITTVGYGDIVPQTPLGQALAAMAMLTGYAIIAIPTGIVTAELTSVGRDYKSRMQKECPQCHKDEHATYAHYCDNCGTELVEESTQPS